MKPNIVYLHSHDTGRYVQPYGYAIPTPNIQLLADQGVLFRKAFCAAPSCSGSRAALVTGQYPHNNGMTGLAHRGFALNDYGQHIVHTLRDAGYHSELIGEQHISADPQTIGYDNVTHVDRNHVETVAPLAVDFLQHPPSQPFFLSVGYFETHRNFFEPSSVRDTLYSQPPPHLPDLPEVRQDMAAFKASARSLDQGVGAVLNAVYTSGIADNTLIICTTDHGLAFPAAKGTTTDRGTGVMLIVRGPGFTGGRVVDSLVSHIDIYPTLCELAGLDCPDFLQGRSLMPLVRGETDSIRDEVFSELSYHVAYDPQRSVRTDRWRYLRRFGDHPYPVLANCDDGPTKDKLIELGWADTPLAGEQLYDLALDPHESNNLAGDPAFAGVRDELRARLERWMAETGDPLLDGPVPAPPGARLCPPTAVSPGGETYTVGEPVAP